MKTQTTVLIAESDPESARQLTAEFRKHRWGVIRADDAESVVAASLRTRPDAIVLSNNLPAGGSSPAINRLRASAHTANTPILVLCIPAFKDESLTIKGADECWPRPQTPAAIATWVQQRLETSRVVLQAPESIALEAERIAALTRTGLLDSPPTASFDAVAHLTAVLTGVAIASIALVDTDRIFFTSINGRTEPFGSAREAPRMASFAQWVVMERHGLFVGDIREHPVLRNSGALRSLGAVACAGVPLSTSAGPPVGALCAIDKVAREWSERDVAQLRDLARIADALIVVAELAHTPGRAGAKPDAAVIPQADALRAIGLGIYAATDILSREDPRLGQGERKFLTDLIESLGEELVRHARGAS